MAVAVAPSVAVAQPAGGQWTGAGVRVLCPLSGTCIHCYAKMASGSSKEQRACNGCLPPFWLFPSPEYGQAIAANKFAISNFSIFNLGTKDNGGQWSVGPGCGWTRICKTAATYRRAIIQQELPKSDCDQKGQTGILQLTQTVTQTYRVIN